MRATRLAVAATISMAAALGGVSAVPESSITVAGGTPRHHELAAWAFERFASAGLELPPLEIGFHEDRSECADHLGYYEDGVVASCHRHLDDMAARGLVHEMAHGWLEAFATDEVRRRFLALRGLETWNDWDVEWDARGFEQAAEIIAWAVGDQADGTRAPSFDANSRPELAIAYELLTGSPLPELKPSMVWVPA